MKIQEPISVVSVFNHARNNFEPVKIFWGGEIHQIIKIGLHHSYKHGNVLFHVFSVSSKKLFFRLVFNTQNLHWRVEEISDGLPD